MSPRSITRSLVRLVRRPFCRRPRIILTLLCRDEEDIIGYNIAYHLAQGIDLVIVTDNASQDHTPSVLQRFVEQGKLHLIREPSLTLDQGLWVTRMARIAAARFDADWVINGDADEFWISRAGTLRESLRAMPRDASCLAVPRYDMAPPRDPEPRFFESMLVRVAGGETVHGRPSLPKVCHRAHRDVRLAEGNHFVMRRGERMAERSDHPLEILHFPLRSPAQFERKIRQGAEALASNPRLAPSFTGHWRQIYRDQFQAGRLAAYYDERAPDPARIEAGLSNGTYVRDLRIRDALRRLDPALVEPGGGD